MSDVIEDRHDVAARLRELLARDDGPGLAALLDPMPISEALREILIISPSDRDAVLTLMPPELAAELVERLGADKAAEIIEELDSDAQADLIGDLDQQDAEAILAEMDTEDAADVRRLAEYDDDTAGGLMVAEAFTFAKPIRSAPFSSVS